MSATGDTQASPRVPQFPPIFSSLAVLHGREPMAVAEVAAAKGESGAGDLFWSPDRKRAAAAFVLEPEVPLARAVQMAPTLMVAMGDALGAIGPPALAITFRWPFTVLANGGRVGGVSVALPAEAKSSRVPELLIVGFDLALGPTDAESDPGLHPESTVLHEEGCGDIDRTTLLEAVARHFLVWIDTWQEEGFRPVHQSWLSRAHDLERPVELSFSGGKQAGRMIGLDEEGGLLLKDEHSTRAIPLLDAVAPCR